MSGSWDGLRTEEIFDAALAREIVKGRSGVLARLAVHGAGAGEGELWRLAVAMAGPQDQAVLDGDGGLWLLLPELSPGQARNWLLGLAQRISASRTIRSTPEIGYVVLGTAPGWVLKSRATIAMGHAGGRLDLEPVRWTPELTPRHTAPTHARVPRWRRILALPVQVAVTLALVLVVPFAAYTAAFRAGFDLAQYVYVALVVSLVISALLLWTEAFLATRSRRLPPEPSGAAPPAAAIIAAYLPNEAATIVETVRAFLAVDYPGPYEVLLAYNSPQELPVEQSLREIDDHRFQLIHVPHSTSKAQNVNYALDRTGAAMIGVFDADHHPEPGSFRRAWRWLAAGHDVVQGHCLVRNGDRSWVARLVAVEFELIYAVFHPGRAALHGFGLFGGSNGFWRSDVLRQTRMHGFMLTEDIDSSLRVIEQGGRIVTDPGLISRELAPVRLTDLANQRLRWAQGWFQVSLRHVRGARTLPLRKKLGFLHLLGWREVYPWLSLQIYPILAFWLVHAREDGWIVPIFVLTTAFTLGTGPVQAVVAYRCAHPDIRARRRWFWSYLLLSVVFYSHFKNMIALLAQTRQMLGVGTWRVTPRGLYGERRC